MEEQHTRTDDQSHYEISLTAGQAFVAFVLMLLSLAASFAFGLMIGKGQADERLVVRKETPVVTEGALVASKAKAGDGRIVELGVAENDFEQSDTAATDTAAGDAATATAPEATASIVEAVADAETVADQGAPKQPETAPAAAAQEPAARPGITTYAQLLSTGDQKTAESLAARLIDRGFNNAYVERGATEKGPIFRVRVKFPSETDARAAETRLREFSKDVWITTK